MNTRTLKLLTASTAFVAATAAANGAYAVSDTISVSQTSPIFISNTTAGTVSITSGVVISTPSNMAIEVSDTGANTAAVINVGTGATVSSAVATGTIGIMPNSSVTAITVNNSGTIVNTGTGAAISSTITNAAGSAIGLTVNNTGTISGTVNSGAGALTYTGTNGTKRGDITSTNSAGTDAVTLTSSTLTGNVSLGAGTNNFTVSKSTVTGNYTGGAGADTVNIKDSSTFTGDIALSTGTDGLTVSNSTVTGNITSGNGVTNVTLTNATVTGNITDSQASDSDVLTINGANAFTTHGTIDGFETINFNTNSTVNNAISNGSNINIAAGKTVTANATIGAGTTGTLTNSGTLNIAANKQVSVGSYVGSGNGTLGIAIASSNTTTGMGQLVVTGGGSIGAGSSVTINVASTAGYINSGTQYTIVDGAGTAGAVSLTNASTGVYRFSTANSAGDLVLTVGRVSTSNVVTGEDNKAIAGVLDNISSTTNTQLVAVQGAVGSQSTASGVTGVMESLAPGIDGVGAAGVNFSTDTGNQVSTRLASLRSTSGVATGDPMAANHMWVQGFGSTVSQDDKNGARGYDAKGAGASMGLDTDTLVDGMTTGLAFSYGKGTVDSNATGGASTDIDTYALTGYGSQVLSNGMFVNGQLGFGYNKYDTSRVVSGVGTSKGSTDGWQGSAKVETGHDYALGGMTLTPQASLQYTYLDVNGYTETGAGGASLRVKPDALSALDAGVGGELSYAMPLNDGGTLKPSMHAKYIYRMGDDSLSTTSQFVGGGTSFDTKGVKADRSSVNVGAGLLLTTYAGTDISLNYDADIRSSLIGHTGQIKARWAF